MVTRAPVIEYCFTRGDEFTGDEFTFGPSADADVPGIEFWDNFAVKAQMRPAFDGDLIHEFALNASVADDGGIGVLTLTLGATPTDTSAFSPGDYVGDLEVSSDNFPKRTVALFRFHVNPDVTH